MIKLHRNTWDVSQMTASDRDELRHILRARYNLRAVPDGLDDGNEDLNGLRCGIYEDLSHPAPRAPEIPDEYTAHPAIRVLNWVIIIGLAINTVVFTALFLGHGYTHILFYVALGAVVLLLGNLSRK